ncbi:MAG: hypothetical protein VX730_03330 [Pseudomonadota bacterium]|nr:hypothetical protein [Pseudomonadota bacterium]
MKFPYLNKTELDFAEHIITKFNLSGWLNLTSDKLSHAILEPLEELEYADDIGIKIHHVEDALYRLAKKKALFTPYPEGEMTRTFYLLLEEYYNYFGIPYTDEDINIDNTWKIDGHIVHKEHIPEFTEEKPQNISKTHTKVWGGEIKVYEHSDPVWQKVYDELDAFNDHVIHVLDLEQKFFVAHEDIASWLSTFIISGLQTLGNPLEKIGCELGTFDVAIRNEFYRECDKGNVPEDAQFESMESEILAEFIKYFKLG